MTAPTPSGLELAAYRRVGRSLRTTRDFGVGDVVLRDHPLLEWNVKDFAAGTGAWEAEECLRWSAWQASGLLTRCGSVGGDEDVSHGDNCTPLDVPVYLAAAAAAYCHPDVPAATRLLVQDMHVPDLRVSSSLYDVTLFCQRLSRRISQSQRSSTDLSMMQPHHILHAIFAAKVNAHVGQNGAADAEDRGGWWRMYRWGSKLAHSCAPNTAYSPVSHAFVAICPIAAGSLVAFSYVGGPMLLLGTHIRQQRLLNSHLFACQCLRCQKEDWSRVIRKPQRLSSSSNRNVGEWLVRQSSPLTDADDDVFPRKPWHLTTMTPWQQRSLLDTNGDACDSELQAELDFESASVTSLGAMLGISGLGSATLKLRVLAPALMDLRRILGVRHSLYTVALGLCGNYVFRLLKLCRASPCGASKMHSLGLLTTQLQLGYMMGIMGLLCERSSSGNEGVEGALALLLPAATLTLSSRLDAANVLVGTADDVEGSAAVATCLIDALLSAASVRGLDRLKNGEWVTQCRNVLHCLHAEEASCCSTTLDTPIGAKLSQESEMRVQKCEHMLRLWESCHPSCESSSAQRTRASEQYQYAVQTYLGQSWDAHHSGVLTKERRLFREADDVDTWMGHLAESVARFYEDMQ